MLRWTLGSLWEDRLIAVASAGGIALALMLALYLDAVARGEADQIVAFLEHSPAEVWVLQKGVEDLHMARSTVTDLAVAETLEVPGVERVLPLVYRDVRVGEPGEERVGYLVGVPEGTSALEPWDVPLGATRPGPGEVVAPASLVEANGLGLGDSLLVEGRRLSIVGLSRGTFSMANPLLYTSETEARRLLDRRDGANALLVQAATGHDAADLAMDIEKAVDDVRALARAELIANDREIGLQMGGAVVRLMTVVAGLVSAVILAFTVFVFTANRRRELAVAAALGASRSALMRSALLQSTVIAVLGWSLAGATAPLLGLVLSRFVPEVAVRFSPTSLGIFGAATLSIALLATLLPARRILQLDPAVVFNS